MQASETLSSVSGNTASSAREKPSSGLFRYSRWDVLLLGCALLHGVALGMLVYWQSSVHWLLSLGLVSIGVCWNSNTISHNHLHNPIFRSRWGNHVFAWYLTVLLSIPQSLWKERHLWHHAGEPEDYRKRGWSLQRVLEYLSIGALWGLLLWQLPDFFLWSYLPGFLLGLAFCQLQGHYEHAGELSNTAGISHYGFLYNFFWFNDGFHAEHHRYPRMHWHALPTHRLSIAQESNWSPHWRWLSGVTYLRWLNHWSGAFLGWLERWVIGNAWLQGVVLSCHKRAFQDTLATLSDEERASLHHIAIVGGGLFPRTLLVLRELLPESRFTILEQDPAHIEEAKSVLAARGIDLTRVAFVERAYGHGEELPEGTDGLVIPMAYLGTRGELYDLPPAAYTWLHDWCWRRRGTSAVVAWWLLKRLNLVQARTPDAGEVEPSGADS